MKSRHAFLLSLLFLLPTQAARAVEVSFEQDNSLPLVHVNLAIRAGSVTDPAGAAGLTDFVGRDASARNQEALEGADRRRHRPDGRLARRREPRGVADHPRLGALLAA